jgi:polyamine oxidase
MRARFLSRRDLLLSGGAFAVAGVAGASVRRRSVRAANAWDTIVVGAGVAGIAAARSIRASGGSVLMLEALHRVGGRLATSASPAAHFDPGTMFFNTARKPSALYQLALRAGIPMSPTTSTPVNLARNGGGAFAGTYAAMLTALVERAELVRDRSIPDERAFQTVRALRDLPHFAAALMYLGIRDDDASLLDYHQVASRTASPFVFPADDTRYVASGIGSFVASLADGVPAVFNATVSSIAYAGGDVEVRTTNGRTFRAQKAILTVPTTRLASDAITFDPPLPMPTIAAVHALPIRHASSHATVGNAAARIALSQPIERVIYFAGEATAPPGLACTEGAFAVSRDWVAT